MPSEASRAKVVAKLKIALEQLLDGEVSYAELPAEAVMSAAGMSRRSFYVYFADKAQVIDEVAAEASRQMLSEWRPWWHAPAPPSRAGIDVALHEMLEVYRPHRNLLRAVTETASFDRRVAETYRRTVAGVAEELNEHIETGQRRGTVNPELRTPTAAQWIAHFLSTGLAELASAPGADHERHVVAAREILWKTLYATAQPVS